MLWYMCEDWRTILRIRFSPFTFMWVLGVKLRSSDLHGKPPNLMSLFASPVTISLPNLSSRQEDLPMNAQ